MSIKKSIVLAVLISASTACGFFIGQSSKSSENVKAENPPDTDAIIPNLVKILSDSQIQSIGVSENDEGKIRARVIRKINKPCDQNIFVEGCEKFVIYDENGREIFEYKDFGIIGNSFARLINSDSSQMILETNGGGTDDFLHIFDYKNNKYSEIVNPASDFLQFAADIFRCFNTGQEWIILISSRRN